MSSGEGKIVDAVQKCLAYAKPAENDRIRRILEFVHVLKSRPEWAESEITEVTDRVLASLAEDAEETRRAFRAD